MTEDSLGKQLVVYFNPFERLGEKNYSHILPLLTTLLAALLIEYLFTVILETATGRGLLAILLFTFFVVYFSLRDAIKGGFVAAMIAICYYAYIVFSTTAAVTTQRVQMIAVFALAYLIIAWVIGKLRQSIDNLIEKESEYTNRLSAVIEQLTAGVVITDEKGTIEFVNKQAEKILGVKIPLGINLHNKPLLETYSLGKLKKRNNLDIRKLMHIGDPVKGLEYEVARPDGKIIVVGASMSFVKNNKGKVIATTTIFQDITGKKQEEKRKDDFVNMASHELKTPITSLKLYINSLEKLSSVNGRKKVVTGIKSQVDRLQKLVSELLDVSRLQTGKMVYSKELFTIEELIKDAIDDMQLTKKQRRVIFDYRKKTKVYADKLRITQVINNLLANALKYSPNNKNVIVKVKRENSKVLVGVRDYGIGINKDQQKKIFDRLYQVTDDYEKTFPGLGMGLFIAKEIIEYHKGRLWVESTKGKGSTFYFTLPMAKK
jgi:PAS domain S-box-containing protein